METAYTATECALKTKHEPDEPAQPRKSSKRVAVEPKSRENHSVKRLFLAVILCVGLLGMSAAVLLIA